MAVNTSHCQLPWHAPDQTPAQPAVTYCITSPSPPPGGALRERDEHHDSQQRMLPADQAEAPAAQLAASPSFQQKRKSPDSPGPETAPTGKRIRFTLRPGASPNANGDVASSAATRAEHSPARAAAAQSDLASRLEQAATSGDIETLKELGRLGVALDQVLEYGATALCIAASRGHLQAIGVLTSMGAHVDAVDNKGLTPLIHAARGKHPEALKALLDAHASVNYINSSWETALLAAAGRYCAPVGDGCVAVDSRRTECLRILLDHGADIHQMDRKLRSALHYCSVCSNDAQAIMLLLDRGAEINAATADLHSALSIACARNKPNIVQALLERGAEINMRRERARHLPVATLARGSETRAFTHIRDQEQGTRLRVVMQPEDWKSPATVEMLMRWLTAQYGSEETLLALALKAGSNQSIYALLEHGADPHWRDSGGNTVIEEAGALGKRGACDLLRHHGMLRAQHDLAQLQEHGYAQVMESSHARAWIDMLGALELPHDGALARAGDLAVFNVHVRGKVNETIRMTEALSPHLAPAGGALTHGQRVFARTWRISRMNPRTTEFKQGLDGLLGAERADRLEAISRGQAEAIREICAAKAEALAADMVADLFRHCLNASSGSQADIEASLAEAGWFAPLTPYLAAALRNALSEMQGDDPAEFITAEGKPTARGKILLDALRMHVWQQQELAKEAGWSAAVEALPSYQNHRCKSMLDAQLLMMETYL